MKLIAKNLTGILKDGKRYKVSYSRESDGVLKNHSKITLSLDCLDCDLGWISKDLVCGVYTSKKDYKEALKRTLTRAEKQFGIKLLRTNIKIAS